MLKPAPIFFITAIVAAAFGFTGIASATAKFLFLLFLAVAVAMPVLGTFAGRKTGG